MAKCFNCGSTNGTMQLIDYKQAESSFWQVRVDGKRHRTCSDCVVSYRNKQERAKRIAEEDARQSGLLEQKKAEAQSRADAEQEVVYVIQTKCGLFAVTMDDIYKYHQTDSMMSLHTAYPTPRQEVTREQLLEVRNQLLQEIEENSDLPEVIYGDTLGVTSQTPRRQFICKGYAYRVAEPDARELAGMITGMLFNLNLNGKQYYHLRAMPNPELIKRARIITAQYYYAANAEPASQTEQPAPAQSASNEPKDGQDIAKEAKAGDTIIFDSKGMECEGVFYGSDQHSVLVETPNGMVLVVKHEDILGLKKAELLTGIHPDMPQIERDIICTILDDALKAGYTVTVHDGGEAVLRKSSNKKDIFSALYSTGSDRLFFYQDNKIAGWIWLIYGNQADIIADYTDNPAMEALLANADKLAEQYS